MMRRIIGRYPFERMEAPQPKTFGVLGPLIHPEHYRIRDSRIAANWCEFTHYVCRLVKERPELLDRFFLDDQRLTMH